MTLATTSPTQIRSASIAILAGGALWGLYWIPIRQFESLGLTGPWPSLAMNAATLVLIFPLLMLRKPSKAPIISVAVTGLITGAAFASYGTAIMLTDVLHAMLFFYLTPIWGTAIGVFLLGERLTFSRIAAIVLALSGLITVIGFGSRSALNVGDFLALLSGGLWAVGSYRLYKFKGTSPIDQAISFLFGSVLVTLVFIWLIGDRLGGIEGMPDLQGLTVMMMIAGAFSIPMIFLTLWPASVLSPGRIGILLMSEIVVGVTSVAMLAGEPFGPFEAVGTVLILAASIVEVTGTRA